MNTQLIDQVEVNKETTDAVTKAELRERFETMLLEQGTFLIQFFIRGKKEFTIA